MFFICLFHLFTVPLPHNQKVDVMNTMVGTIPMNAVLTMLNSLSRHDRRWLVEQMSAQVAREEAEAKRSWHVSMEAAPSWKEESDARLDAALARFHKDWGGDKNPMEIANDLRQGAEMVKDVDVW